MLQGFIRKTDMQHGIRKRCYAVALMAISVCGRGFSSLEESLLRHGPNQVRGSTIRLLQEEQCVMERVTRNIRSR